MKCYKCGTFEESLRANRLEMMVRFVKKCVGTLCAVVVVSCSANGDVEKARSFLQSGDTTAAISELEIGVQQKDIESMELLAGLYFDAMQFEKAEHVLTELLTTSRLHNKYYYHRGVARLAQENFEGARSDFTVAMDSFEPTVQMLNKRAEAYVGEGRVPMAFQDLDQAIALDSSAVESYFAKANIYFELGNYSMADSMYSQALAQAPDSPILYHNRGNARTQTGDIPGALADYSKALELFPGNTDALLSRANAYYNIREFDKAVEDFHRVLEIDPRQLDAWHYIGRVRFQQGKYKEAEAAVTKYIEMRPDYHYSWHQRAEVRLAAGDKQGAVDDLNEYLRRNRNANEDAAGIRKLIDSLGFESIPYEYQRVTQESGSFSFEAPNEWYVAGFNDTDVAHFFVSREKLIDELSRYSVGATVSMIVNLDQYYGKMTSEEIVAKFVNDANASAQESIVNNVLSETNVTVSGFTGVRREIEAQDFAEFPKSYIRQLIVSRDNILYMVNLECVWTEREAFMPVLDRIESTLDLTTKIPELPQEPSLQ